MRVRKKIYMLLLLIFGTLNLVMFITERATEQYILTHIGRITLYDFLFIFLCLIVIGLSSLLIHSWRKAVRKFTKVIIVFGWIGTIGMLMVGSLIWFGNYAVTTWYEFNSPDKKYSLVAEESSFLTLGNIRLYERTSSVLVRRLDVELSPDNGFAAISQGAYKISWKEDVVTLSVDMNEHGLWNTVKINMADNGKVLAEFSNYPNGKPASAPLVSQSDVNKNYEHEEAQQRLVEQRIIDGLRAVALTTGNIEGENSEISFTAKGTPKLVLSSKLYILYDRESSNGKCALYVLYQSKNDDELNSDSQILEMYAYEYSTGKVIVANRHSWNDVGTDEYYKATGE